MIGRAFIAVVAVGLACGSLLLPGCDRTDPASTQPAKDSALESTVERGPVRMVVRVDKNRITIADKLNLTVAVAAAEGVDVQMPHFGENLDEFTVRDFREYPAIPSPVGRTWRQEYVLDILLSGEYKIPAITAKFVDYRSAATLPSGASQPAPIEAQVTSEPITVQVDSLLQGEFDPAQFKDIKGTVDLPVQRSYRWLLWLLAGMLVLAALVGGLVWWNRRSRRETPPVPVPAHIWAKDQLARLRDDRLVQQGLVQEFYFRLTGVVRGYIERRFDIMAAEQTTDEFLAASQNHPSLAGRYRSLLSDFLRAGDLVKFAKYRPDEHESELAMACAEDFVNRTAKVEVPAGGQPTASARGERR